MTDTLPSNIQEPTKMGRPIKYTPEYCERVQLARLDGSSIVSARVKLGIARSTFYEWQKTYPEFAEACEKAEDFAMKWWEDTGKEAMLKRTEIQVQLYNQMMDRQFGSTKVSDSSKTEIHIGNMNVLQNLSQEDFQARLQQKLIEKGLLPNKVEDDLSAE